MWAAAFFVVAAALASLLPAARADDGANFLAQERQGTEPEIEGSDKRFQRDYPEDLRPKVIPEHFHFGHPYPAVQDSDDFDADYVKDENKDNGEWKAQMDYDELRRKIQGQWKRVQEAQRKELAEQQDLEEAKKAESAAEQAAEDAERRAMEAAERAKHAQEKLDDLTGGTGGAGGRVGGALGEALSDVEKEVNDLEECKRKLAEARRKLKKLLEEHQIKAAAEDKAKAAKDAEEMADPALQEEVADEEGEAMWDKKVLRAKEEHAAAKKSYEDLKEDVEATEAELNRAAEKLRKFRRETIDSDGGVYYKTSEAAPSDSADDSAAAPRLGALGAPVAALALLVAALAP